MDFIAKSNGFMESQININILLILAQILLGFNAKIIRFISCILYLPSVILLVFETIEHPKPKI
jgi:hypothetical protein